MSMVVKVGDNAASCGNGIIYNDKPENVKRLWQWLRWFVRDGLGNLVTVPLIQDPAEMRRVISYLVAHKLHFYFTAIRENGGGFQLGSKWRKLKPHEFYSPKSFADMVKAGGKYYAGRWALVEAGGMLYWPRTYLIGRREREYEVLPQVADLRTAQANYVGLLKRVMRVERRMHGAKLFSVDGSMLFKYAAKAGLRVLALESMAGNPHRMYAAMRGAARAWDIAETIGYIAYMWYGGFGYDATWLKRWKINLRYAYLAGCTAITGESPMYGGLAFIQDGRHPAAVAYRAALKEFYGFCRAHPRLGKRPRATLGVVYGQLDGCPGLWNQWVWGQYRQAKWRNGPAEQGWELADGLMKKDEWINNLLTGEHDFSGNPPFGQYDIVPAEAGLSILKQYRCLVFLGWNTMTPDLYRKLKAFVRGGGRLIMSVPHLATQTDRGAPLKLFRNGDVRDLFGVRLKPTSRKTAEGVKFFTDSRLKSYRFPNWGIHVDPKFINPGIPLADVEMRGAAVLATTGQAFDHNLDDQDNPPVLVENRCGRGMAFLLLSRDYPGAASCRGLMQEILRVVSAGEQGRIKLAAPAGLRYAVYNEKRVEAVYLLNTDLDNALSGKLFIDDLVLPLAVRPTEFRIVLHSRGVALSPENSEQVQLEPVASARQRICLRVKAGRPEIVIMASARRIRRVAWNKKKIAVKRTAPHLYSFCLDPAGKSGELTVDLA